MEYEVKLPSPNPALPIPSSTSPSGTASFSWQPKYKIIVPLAKIEGAIPYWPVSSSLLFSSKDDFLTIRSHCSLTYFICFFSVVYLRNPRIHCSNQLVDFRLTVWPDEPEFCLGFIFWNHPCKADARG